MEDLKFPIIKGRMSPNKLSSADDYLKFIIFYLKYIAPSSRGEKTVRSTPVNVPFYL